MKVLFITRKFPPAIGGMEQFSAGLAKAFGKDMTVIAWAGSQAHLIWWIPYALVRGVRAARQVDVIHLGDGVLVWLGVMLKWFTGKPVSITIHGLDVTYRRFGYQWMIWSGLRRLSHSICVSTATAQLLRDHGMADNRVSSIPNGIHSDDWPLVSTVKNATTRKHVADLISLPLQDDTKLLLTVGRLVKRKGVQWFIRHVMTNLPPNMFYIIAGSGPEQSAVEQAIVQAKLTDRVALIGRVADERMPALYAAADLFIMPNQPTEHDYEGFGIVALEAALCGTPVIASKLEGIQDAVIDGATGYLVESSSFTAWKQAIQQAMQQTMQTGLDQQNEPQWSPLAIRQSIIDRFDWTIIVKRYRTVFHNMLS